MKNKVRDPYDSSSSEGYLSELSEWDLPEDGPTKSTTIRYERPEGVKGTAAKQTQPASDDESEESYYDEEEEAEVEETVKEATQHIQQQKEKRTQPAAAAQKAENGKPAAPAKQQEQRKPQMQPRGRGGMGN